MLNYSYSARQAALDYLENKCYTRSETVYLIRKIKSDRRLSEKTRKELLEQLGEILKGFEI